MTGLNSAVGSTKRPICCVVCTHLMLNVALPHLRSNGFNSLHLDHFLKPLCSNLAGNLGWGC